MLWKKETGIEQDNLQSTHDITLFWLFLSKEYFILQYFGDDTNR